MRFSSSLHMHIMPGVLVRPCIVVVEFLMVSRLVVFHRACFADLPHWYVPAATETYVPVVEVFHIDGWVLRLLLLCLVTQCTSWWGRLLAICCTLVRASTVYTSTASSASESASSTAIFSIALLLLVRWWNACGHNVRWRWDGGQRGLLRHAVHQLLLRCWQRWLVQNLWWQRWLIPRRLRRSRRWLLAQDKDQLLLGDDECLAERIELQVHGRHVLVDDLRIRILCQLHSSKALLHLTHIIVGGVGGAVILGGLGACRR